MLWGIDREMWITLLAGALGGIPAAVLAALVAMSVLKSSNRKQQELVVLQLKQARQEASEVRERAAVADTLASVMDLLPASMQSREAIHREVSRLRSGLVRWQLELGRGDMTDELHRWEPLLIRAGFNHFDELGKGDLGEAEKAFAILGNMIAALSATAINWQEADDLARADLVRKSAEQRVIGSEALAEMIGVRLGM